MEILFYSYAYDVFYSDKYLHWAKNPHKNCLDGGGWFNCRARNAEIGAAGQRPLRPARLFWIAPANRFEGVDYRGREITMELRQRYFVQEASPMSGDFEFFMLEG